MNNSQEKLIECFLVVFPNLDRSAVPAASVETVREWDSVAQVSLLTVIGEEFQIEIDYEEFDGVTSFAAMAERIEQISRA